MRIIQLTEHPRPMYRLVLQLSEDEFLVLKGSTAEHILERERQQLRAYGLDAHIFSEVHSVAKVL